MTRKRHRESRDLQSREKVNLRAVAGVAAVWVAAGVAVASADTPGLDLRPGVSIYVVDLAVRTQSTCTLGWLVASPTGGVQALTAGHCRTGPTIEARDFSGRNGSAGAWAHSVDSPGAGVLDGDDIAAITLASGLGHDVRMIDGLGPSAVATAEMLRDDPPAQICKRGGQTGVTCGPMTAVSSHRVLFRATVDHGDSGGPVWAVTRTGDVLATAVVAGRSDDDPSIAVGQLINPWLVRWNAELGV